MVLPDPSPSQIMLRQEVVELVAVDPVTGPKERAGPVAAAICQSLSLTLKGSGSKFTSDRKSLVFSVVTDSLRGLKATFPLAVNGKIHVHPYPRNKGSSNFNYPGKGGITHTTTRASATPATMRTLRAHEPQGRELLQPE